MVYEWVPVNISLAALIRYFSLDHLGVSILEKVTEKHLNIDSGRASVQCK